MLLAGILTVAFNVQPVKSDYAWTETIYILGNGGIQPSMAPISSVDGVTYTLTDNIVGNVTGGSSAIIIQRDNIIIDGAGYTLTGTHSQHQTVITPEFSSLLILPMLMILTLLAIAASRRKWSKHQARASFD
jgi:hypothetical protein